MTTRGCSKGRHRPVSDISTYYIYTRAHIMTSMM